MGQTAYMIRTYHPSHVDGIFTLTDGYKPIFTCNTIELADRGNQHQISCIPEGTYEVVPYSSAKFKGVFEVKNVPNRDKILIHVANSTSDILGCIGVGEYAKDGYIINSAKTLAKLKSLTKGFTLKILKAI